MRPGSTVSRHPDCSPWEPRPNCSCSGRVAPGAGGRLGSGCGGRALRPARGPSSGRTRLRGQAGCPVAVVPERPRSGRPGLLRRVRLEPFEELVAPAPFQVAAQQTVHLPGGHCRVESVADAGRPEPRTHSPAPRRRRSGRERRGSCGRGRGGHDRSPSLGSGRSGRTRKTGTRSAIRVNSSSGACRSVGRCGRAPGARAR